MKQSADRMWYPILQNQTPVVLKAFTNKKIQEVEAGATQLCIVPYPPTHTCTLFVKIVLMVFLNIFFSCVFIFFIG